MKTLQFVVLFTSMILLYSCNNDKVKNDTSKQNQNHLPIDSIFTQYSNEENLYIGFNSPIAINTIAKIENEYFNDYKNGISKYYGTSWCESSVIEKDSVVKLFNCDIYKKEMQALNIRPDSFHCTIYAIKALQAGMGDNFEKLIKLHQQRWGNREFAGWSVAYILIEYFDWKACLIIDEYSEEYKRCTSNFETRKQYYVWRQPSIKLKQMYKIGIDNRQIDSMLNQNEFGWGFSNQGIHTWITRHKELKECRWEGAPAKKYDICDNCSPLFKRHQFLEFKDYFSHVVVFPPKIKKEQNAI